MTELDGTEAGQTKKQQEQELLARGLYWTVTIVWAMLELLFIQQIVASIREHSSLFDAFQIVTFQVVLMAAFVTYQRTVRSILRNSKLTPDQTRLAHQISYIVMTLLFSMMFYSHFTETLSRK